MSQAAPASVPDASRCPEPSLDEHRDHLWGLCYRMTGNASDADDLVQETFVRAIERPPRDTSAPWRPWLVRVAMNLARDHLRRRRRQRYHGQWLPTPIETPAAGAVPEPATRDTPEARYDRMESASYAFLLALEALTPAQRAVLVLRDAFGHSVRETAALLEMSEANVKTTHHRARRTMAGYEERRRPPSASLTAEVRSMLERMMVAMSMQDLDVARSLLAADARSLSDGGGVVFAAKYPVVGRDKIAKLYMNLATRTSEEARFEIRTINGVPAIVGEDPDPTPPNAPFFVLRIELDREGRVREIHSVLAPTKLGRVRAVSGG